MVQFFTEARDIYLFQNIF